MSTRYSEHVSVKSLVDLGLNILDWCGGVECAKCTSCLIVFEDGGCALVVRSHTVNKSLSGVILTMHEIFSSNVILALNLGWVESQMV